MKKFYHYQKPNFHESAKNQKAEVFSPEITKSCDFNYHCHKSQLTSDEAQVYSSVILSLFPGLDIKKLRVDFKQKNLSLASAVHLLFFIHKERSCFFL